MFVTMMACVLPPPSTPFVGVLPEDVELNMAGTVTLLPDGTLHLALSKPCIMKVRSTQVANPCDREHFDSVRVVAHTPWNRDARGKWDGPAHIAFAPDWKATGLDPLGDAATAAWDISGAKWMPSGAEAELMLKLVGDATDTETELAQGGPPPALEVTSFEIEGNTLHTGDPSTLVVRIANRGTGTAYRVTATTRSSIAVLHGRRLSFGAIKPGADKVRKLNLTIPPSETGPDTMLVLVLSEGNGVVPANVSRRIPLAPSVAAPMLAVRCSIVGHSTERHLDLDAGQELGLRCAVKNTGTAAATQVRVEASIAGGVPTVSASRAVATGGDAVFDLAMTVPRELPIDAPVEIAITARDGPSSRSARAAVVGVVRKPRLCVAGQLTLAQYRAKLADLRAAVASSELTQAQFDKYDAELVTCLK
jgi:uncharacterized repeat protein (TIGR01451 family)